MDRRTGEPTPDAEAIILPRELTPLLIQLKPGDYLIEAVLPNKKRPPDFAEVYRTIAPLDMVSEKQAQFDDGMGERPPVEILVRVHRFNDVTADMVMVPIDDELRGGNPSLPKVIYIDSRETRPADIKVANKDPAITGAGDVISERYILFADAKRLAEERGKRLLSAIEYDAILRSIKGNGLGDRAFPADFFGGFPEWTTSTFDYAGVGSSPAVTRLRNMLVLRGYDDPDGFRGLQRSADGQLISSPEAQSPMIAFRGARSNTPRFVKP
jgi:hypothetical protein